MSEIQAYDIKARRKVTMKNPQPNLMENGTWVLKGTSSETGIYIFKIVGKSKPTITHSRMDFIKDLFTSRKCECDRLC